MELYKTLHHFYDLFQIVKFVLFSVRPLVPLLQVHALCESQGQKKITEESRAAVRVWQVFFLT